MRYQHKPSPHIPSVIGLVFIIALGFVGYDYLFVREVGAQDATGVTSELVMPEGVATDGGSPLSPEQAALLAKIESIRLDGSILRDPSFLSLQDWTVNLGHIDAGRPNPFEPYAGVPKTQTTPTSR